MFQFPGFPPHALCIYASVTSLQLAGFPHSDIMGSMPACGSPMLFAACHVLLRRLVPWHPPCALLRLITSILRLVTFFRSIDFLIATGLLRLSSRLSSCAVVKVRCELPLTSGFLFRILKTIQSRGRQLFLTSASLPFLRPVVPDCLFY